MNAEANASTRNMSSETWMLPAAKQKMLAKDVSTQQGNAAKAADSYDTATAFYRSVNPNGVANNKNVFSSPSERNKNYKGKGK
jgi:hypothetical protein